MPAINGDRMRRSEKLSLFAGALLGSALLAAIRTDPMYEIGDEWRFFVFTFYSAVTGLTLAGMLWLLYYRVAAGRRWPAAAVSLWVIGCVTLLMMPLVARSPGAFAYYADPHAWYESLPNRQDPKIELLAAFYQCWPLTCLALLFGCSFSFRQERWWLERLGMFVLACWSLPALFVLYHLWIYLFKFESLSYY